MNLWNRGNSDNRGIGACPEIFSLIVVINNTKISDGIGESILKSTQHIFDFATTAEYYNTFKMLTQPTLSATQPTLILGEDNKLHIRRVFFKAFGTGNLPVPISALQVRIFG